jgi:hypothetical protein
MRCGCAFWRNPTANTALAVCCDRTTVFHQPVRVYSRSSAVKKRIESVTTRNLRERISGLRALCDLCGKTGSKLA